jgi:hypothetical protein
MLAAAAAVRIGLMFGIGYWEMLLLGLIRALPLFLVAAAVVIALVVGSRGGPKSN